MNSENQNIGGTVKHETTEKTEGNSVSVESKTFSCIVPRGDSQVLVEGLATYSTQDSRQMFDVQVFMNDRFYTFGIAQQRDRQYLVRLIKVHDRTGTFLGMKTLLKICNRVEVLFELLLLDLVHEA